jgi:hypothetical protein
VSPGKIAVAAAGVLAAGALALGACVTEEEQAPCVDGERVACGVVVGADTNTLTCGLGETECVDGSWLSCEVDYYESREWDGEILEDEELLYQEQTLGTSEPCINNPCNPYCSEFTDGPDGIATPPGLEAGPGGITLSDGSAAPGNTDGLLVSPDVLQVTVNSIPTTGALGWAPAPAKFTAQFTEMGAPIAPTDAIWSLSDYDYSLIGSNGVLDVMIEPVPHFVTVTAQASGFSDTAQLEVTVDVIDKSGSPSAAVLAAFELPPPATPVNVLYPYRDTVFPRNLPAPRLMWSGSGTASWVRYCLIFRDPAHGNQRTFRYCKVEPEASPKRGTFKQRAWTAFDVAASGQNAEMTIQRMNGTTQFEATTIPITFSNKPMRGTIYFWDIGAQNVSKIDESFALTQNILPYKSGDNCIGCHAVSSDGTTLVAVSKGSTTRAAYNLNSASIWYTDGVGAESIALSPNGGLTFLNTNGTSGTLYTTNAAPARKTVNSIRANMQYMFWSPVGNHIAYSIDSGATNGGIGVFDILTASPWTVSNHSEVKTAWIPGYPHLNYPAFTPDAAHITFNVAEKEKNKDGNHYLYLMERSGANTRELARANGKGTGGAVAADWVKSGRARFSPTASGGYNWMLFTSKRGYGNVLPTPSGTTQLWISAVDESIGASGDPSHPAFWVPAQSTSNPNTEPFFVKSACRAVTKPCSFNEDCCGYDAMNPPASSAKCIINQPVTQPVTRSCKALTPFMCQDPGAACAVDTDCCSYPANVCIFGLCAPAAQPPQFSTATFVRDYEATCGSGQTPVWTIYRFRADTPGDSSIIFEAATAPSQADLNTAPRAGLTTAINQLGVWNYVNVDAVVEHSRKWLRVYATLTPSTDLTLAPTLIEWGQLYDCVDNE